MMADLEPNAWQSAVTEAPKAVVVFFFAPG
jgi:hypothetical protein